MKITIALWTLALAGALPPAHAQTAKWPEKPVRVVVPFAAGGSTDIIARVLTAKLSQEYGQQFVVDNRGGAGGSIGAEIVARANPDGYTLIIVATSYATNAALYKIAVRPGERHRAGRRAAPGPFRARGASRGAREEREGARSSSCAPSRARSTSASSGVGGATHLATEFFRQLTKTDMIHVPYKGDGPAMADLIGGQVQVIFSSVPALIAHLKSGRVRGLAVTTEQRFPELPDLPSVVGHGAGLRAHVVERHVGAARARRRTSSRA